MSGSRFCPVSRDVLQTVEWRSRGFTACLNLQGFRLAGPGVESSSHGAWDSPST